MSNWLWFLVPVQSHYVEILEGTRNLENTSYKKVGEWGQFGSLNLGLGINNIFLQIHFSIFDLFYCLPKIVLQVKVTIDSLPLTSILRGHKCIWSSWRLIYAHPHTCLTSALPDLALVQADNNLIELDGKEAGQTDTSCTWGLLILLFPA